MGQSDPQVYYDSMKHYLYGYGLFQPESISKLRPGICGYIDESGRWEPIVDLTDNSLVVAASYTAIGPLQRSVDESQAWEPRVASTVKSIKLNIESDASALSAGLPIDAKLAFKYSTSANFGAILMCDSEVVVESYDYRDPFRDWLNQNSDKLLANHPTVKEHGIYVATTTYSSSGIHINVWQDSEDEITLGCKVGVPNIGSLGPSMTWMRGSTTHGWTHYVNPNERQVMFFGGIMIKFRRINLGGGHKRTEEIPQGEWKGEASKFVFRNLAEDGDHYEAELEMIGDPPREMGANGHKG